MKAVILAAGKGERLSAAINVPKPLTPLLGLTVIERAILSLKECGITDFVIVVGYRSEEVKRYVESRFHTHADVNIKFVQNEEFDEGNGLSVWKAREAVDNEDFILMMCDHVFEPGIVKQLLSYAPGTGKCILCVDRPENVFDLADATKVLVVGERGQEHPKSIGKGLKEYNAIDCGIFYCTPAIFNALSAAIASGDTALTGAVQRLIQSDELGVLDIHGRFWCDIDTPDSLKHAEKKMLSSLGKPADGIISRHINRKVSTRIFTPLILKLYKGVTPTQVSLLSFAVAALSAILFFLSHPIAGGIFIQLSSILDGCDGEIARLKKMSSNLGNFIDAILDRYADGLILLGMFYYSATTMGGKEMLSISWSPFMIIVISVLAILGNLMVSYTSAKSVANFNYQYKGRWIATGRGRDSRLFILFTAALLSYFSAIFVLFALIIIALLTNIIVIWRTVLSWKMFKKDEE